MILSARKYAKHLKNRAPAPKYVSTKQLSLTEFESPFERNLNPSNRWVILSKLESAEKL